MEHDSSARGLIKALKEELLCSKVGDITFAVVLAGSFLFFLNDLRLYFLTPLLMGLSNAGREAAITDSFPAGLYGIRIAASAVQFFVSFIVVLSAYRWAHSVEEPPVGDDEEPENIESPAICDRDLGSLAEDLSREEEKRASASQP
jgi:hypothetical protein